MSLIRKQMLVTLSVKSRNYLLFQKPYANICQSNYAVLPCMYRYSPYRLHTHILMERLPHLELRYGVDVIKQIFSRLVSSRALVTYLPLALTCDCLAHVNPVCESTLKNMGKLFTRTFNTAVAFRAEYHAESPLPYVCLVYGHSLLLYCGACICHDYKSRVT